MHVWNFVAAKPWQFVGKTSHFSPTLYLELTWLLTDLNSSRVPCQFSWDAPARWYSNWNLIWLFVIKASKTSKWLWGHFHCWCFWHFLATSLRLARKKSNLAFWFPLNAQIDSGIITIEGNSTLLQWASQWTLWIKGPTCYLVKISRLSGMILIARNSRRYSQSCINSTKVYPHLSARDVAATHPREWLPRLTRPWFRM